MNDKEIWLRKVGYYNIPYTDHASRWYVVGYGAAFAVPGLAWDADRLRYKDKDLVTAYKMGYEDGLGDKLCNLTNMLIS